MDLSIFVRHHSKQISAAVFCLIFVQTWAAEAQLPAPPVAGAVKVPTPPTVDGRILDDPAWQAVAPLNDFWQTALMPAGLRTNRGAHTHSVKRGSAASKALTPRSSATWPGGEIRSDAESHTRCDREH